MTYVCFTGRGYDLYGRFHERRAWYELARARGYTPTEDAALASILVAARTDTKKARDAVKFGRRVMSYAEFDTMTRTGDPVGAYLDHDSRVGRTHPRSPPQDDPPVVVTPEPEEAPAPDEPTPRRRFVDLG